MCIGQDTYFEWCRHIIRTGEPCDEAKFYNRRNAHECSLKGTFVYKQVLFSGYCPQCADCHNQHMQLTPEARPQPGSPSSIGFDAIISSDPAEALQQAEAHFEEIEACLRASGTGVQLAARKELDCAVGELLGRRDIEAALIKQRNDYRALVEESYKQLKVERGMVNDVLSSNWAPDTVQLATAKARAFRSTRDKVIQELEQRILQVEAELTANPGAVATTTPAIPLYQQLAAELSELKRQYRHEANAEKRQARREIRQEFELEYARRLHRDNARFQQQTAES